MSLWEQVFLTMMQSGVELTITTFGTLLIAGAEAHDYSLVQEASPACLAHPEKGRCNGVQVFERVHKQSRHCAVAVLCQLSLHGK